MSVWSVVALEPFKLQENPLCIRLSVVGTAPFRPTSFRNTGRTRRHLRKCAISAISSVPASQAPNGRHVCYESMPEERPSYGMRVSGRTVSKLWEDGHLTEAVEALEFLVHTGRPVSKAFLYAVLKKCTAKKELGLGSRVHALTVRKGYRADPFLCNHILRMYASHGRLQDAMDVFQGVAAPDAFMWSSIISAHVKHRRDGLAVDLYHRMRRSSVEPDGHVFVAALQACARSGDLKSGQRVHADVLASGLEPDLFVSTGLVNMYAKCGSLEDARGVFDGLRAKNVVIWNAMIAGYSQHNMGQEALRLYGAMQEEGKAPNDVTFLAVLQACASVGTPALEAGKQLHAQIKELGHDADIFVASSLVNMYAKCGSVEDAQTVFDLLGHKNVVTWTAMIAGYAKQGMGHEALRLYSAMQLEGLAVPNSVTFTCLLQACANVAALNVGRQLHAQIIDQELQADVCVVGSLINMYGKCGSMVDAQQVFDGLRERDLVAWSALIAGYTYQGESEVVFGLAQRMRKDGHQPDSITFLSLLTVCSHEGLVEKGWEYFHAMTNHYGITPTVEHYACMVDILGRAGRLDQALALVNSMPVLPTTAVWHTLLGSCRKWRNVEVGRHAFNEAVKLDKKDAAAHVLMSNIYVGAHMWELARKIQSRRKRIRAWKQPAQSLWTDHDGLVHSFLVGDERLPEDLISVTLQLLKLKNGPQSVSTMAHVSDNFWRHGAQLSTVYVYTLSNSSEIEISTEMKLSFFRKGRKQLFSIISEPTVL